MSGKRAAAHAPEKDTGAESLGDSAACDGDGELNASDCIARATRKQSGECGVRFVIGLNDKAGDIAEQQSWCAAGDGELEVGTAELNAAVC